MKLIRFSEILGVFHLQNRNRFGSNLTNPFRDGLLHETKMAESSNEYM